MADKPIVHHIPVCPFSQRLEILLALKGHSGAVDFRVVDITRPRDPELLRKTRGTTALPVLELPDGRILKESLVILDYFDETLGARPLRRADPYERAIERLLIAREGPFTAAGYMFVMNQDPAARDAHRDRLLASYAGLDDFLLEHNPAGTWLFEEFGLAEVVFTPIFKRFWFLEYYEDFDLPQDGEYERVRYWRDACLSHPATQQVTKEEVVKVYYDYAFGAGNGALLEGRAKSSFVFEPHWKERPWPPRGKFAGHVSDSALGLA